MKKYLLYIIVIAAALTIPAEKTDVGKLQPVEVIHMYRQRGQLILETDTGDMGKGKTVQDALDDLKATTPGTIFLDTADYLLVSANAKEFIADAAPYLKSGIRVCLAEAGIALPDAAAYLAAHWPKYTLKEALEAAQLETLTIVWNRLILE